MKHVMILLAFCVCCWSQQCYKVRDIHGNLIFETTIRSLVMQFKNVDVDSFPINSVKSTVIRDTSLVDALKDQLLEALPKPAKADWNYRLEWKTPNGGWLTLIKPHGVMPLVTADSKGWEWFNTCFPSCLDSKKDSIPNISLSR